MKDTMHKLYNDLINKTLISVKQGEDDNIIFITSDYQVFELSHEQNCCESVVIESIVGDLQDLIGEPLMEAEEVSNIDTSNFTVPKIHPPGHDAEDNSNQSDGDWSFYKFGTRKGNITVRFYGETEGPYAVDASMKKLTGPRAEKHLKEIKPLSSSKIEAIRDFNKLSQSKVTFH